MWIEGDLILTWLRVDLKFQFNLILNMLVILWQAIKNFSNFWKNVDRAY